MSDDSGFMTRPQYARRRRLGVKVVMRLGNQGAWPLYTIGDRIYLKPLEADAYFESQRVLFERKPSRDPSIRARVEARLAHERACSRRGDDGAR